MTYGLPFMGSKNRIAEWVVDILPSSDTLYDLFAGGCSVTHCAMLSGKWNNYVINDINPGVTQLFIDAVKNALEGIEDRKQRRLAFCPAVVRKIKELNDETLLADNPLYKSINVGKNFKLESSIRTDRIKSLERLERLERLNGVSSPVKPTRLCLDYRDVEIAPDSTVYCDIPYIGTTKYISGDFDHNAFYEWALSRPFDVYISEYSMPEGFTCIGERARLMTFNSNTSYNTIEKIFINR